MKHEHTSTPNFRQRGYTLTEVMVAITLAVFLLMGLFSILQQTRNASNETTGLSQLQDDERVAMTILTDTIQQAGYTPSASGSLQSMFSPDGVFANNGQLMVGGAGQLVGDKLTVRYVLASNDTALTCLGTANTDPDAKVFKEIFEINNTFPGWGQTLACSSGDGVGEQPLVNNVVNLTFQFAVNTTSAGPSTPSNSVGPNTEASNNMGNGCPADTYIPTPTMSPADWTNVCAVKVDITFNNPLYQPAGQPNPTPGQPQYITFERVISVLSKTGVNVTTVSQT
jgi:type IV pilus assembly protein PilW